MFDMEKMWLILGPVLAAVIGVGLIVVKLGYEQHANHMRIERGEALKKYHDATDCPPPVNVIDWTRRG